ncbi:hypothetical protein AAVH_01862 [Aphelenchoides avenae]|nr:hypothetical protein AAVH_01862 [Aphelenchus avenae]
MLWKLSAAFVFTTLIVVHGQDQANEHAQQVPRPYQFRQYNTGYNANPYNPQAGYNQQFGMPGAGRQGDPQYNTGNFNNGLNQPVNRQFDPRFNSAPSTMSALAGLAGTLMLCVALY